MSAPRNRRSAAIRVALPALVATLAVSCGGDDSSPTAPSTQNPTPVSITVYASEDRAVVWSSSNPERANNVEPAYMVNHVGWGYDVGVGNVVSSIGWGLALRFDVQSQIAGRDVAKATLRLDTLWVRPDLTVTPQIRVRAFQDDWNPAGVNWTVWAGLACHTTGEAQAAAPSAEVPVDFDVTSIVRNWASASWGSYGLKVMVDDAYPGRPSNAITSFQSLGSNRSASQVPRLIVEFR